MTKGIKILAIIALCLAIVFGGIKLYQMYETEVNTPVKIDLSGN